MVERTSDAQQSAVADRDYRTSHTAPEKGDSYDRNIHHGRHRALMWAWEQRVIGSVIRRRLSGRSIQSLDFACGTGRVVGFLEDQVAHATGVDISESMLSVARRKLSRADLHLADLTTDDILGDRRFDLITSFRFFLNAQQDLRDQAITVLVRHLADDGYLIFNNHLPRGCPMHLAIWSYAKLRGATQRRSWSLGAVEEFVRSAGLRVLERHAWGVLPATDNRLPLPGAILGPLENGLSRIPLLRPLSQDVIFVCAKNR